jgi:hypothetical protein
MSSSITRYRVKRMAWYLKVSLEELRNTADVSVEMLGLVV